MRTFGPYGPHISQVSSGTSAMTSAMSFDGSIVVVAKAVAASSLKKVLRSIGLFLVIRIQKRPATSPLLHGGSWPPSTINTQGFTQWLNRSKYQRLN